jgi:hypothetical protein
MTSSKEEGRFGGSASRSPEVLAFLLVAVLALRVAWREPPTAHADSAEYLLTAESLFNHGTPNVHPADLLSFGRIASRFPLEGDYGRPLSHYIPAPDRRLYAVHFWAYPAAALPAKLALRLAGQNEFKAFQLTNTLAWLAALTHVLFLSGLSPPVRRLLAVLLAASPVLPFLLWPHPDSVVFALVASGLVFRHDGRRSAVVLCTALSSLQAAPLALAAFLFWLEAAWVSRRLARADLWRAMRGPSLALVPVVVPALFSRVAYAHASPLALAGAFDPRNISAARVLELFFDLNLGLLPYVPLTLALSLVFAAAQLAGRAGRASAGVSWLVVALAATATVVTGAANWNHGTVGPSRYGLWLLPFVLILVAEGLEAFAGRQGRWVLALAVAAAFSQATIVLTRGGLHAPEDYTRHSLPARLVLDAWPAAYNPSREVFIERTLHLEINPDLPWSDPVVYRSPKGCRKAWLQKRHLPDVAASCGAAPPYGPDFRALKARQGPEAWAYVSW